MRSLHYLNRGTLSPFAAEPEHPELRDKTIVVAKLLILLGGEVGWQTVWSVIEQDGQFARSVLETVSFPPEPGSNFLSHLPEEDLGDL
jgi:hypothetical protein